MTENKRFKMKKLEYESYFIDSQQKYVDEDEPNFKIDGEKTMSNSQILDLLNKNEQLKKETLDLSEELDYYKIKCASLETGLFQADRENGQLKQFKQNLFDLIDEKIKELKNINNVSIIPRESIVVLEQLKKELLE